ncbi:hypothetical protein GYMLUDRAFT_84290 [Collybiopsis luxurians FD-317 M1]|uniref:SAP domain-containing protein n=1 Tax=Collybiopsis luxurians FD-317 M1 TaxID=944289 RepID=A0A0D0BG32_9AGAR|nr:hypothetical protein GYMLUDRAFT_84290 [Collybiopsis luxurians FD-317 M1]
MEELDKDKEYGFPNGVLIKLRKANLAQLKEYCREYGLTIGGNKTALMSRLIEYSSTPKNWTIPTAGARISHKGPRIINVATQAEPKKLSAVNSRRKDILGDDASSQPARIVLRSKDNRTPQEKAALLAWAQRMCERFTDIQTPRGPADSTKPSADSISKIDLNSRLETIEGQLNTLIQYKPFAPSSSACSPISQSLLPPQSHDVMHVQGHPALSSPHLLSASISPEPIPCSQPVPPLQSIEPPPTCSNMTISTNLTLLDSIAPPPLVSSATATTEIAPSPPSATKILGLGDGTELRFTADDVPDPLAISFARDIAQLGRVWDDTHPSFNPAECTLKIKGHAIALRYWPICYGYSHNSRWEGLKKVWNEWKHVAERFLESSAENFWAEFWDAEKNRPMLYTAITKELRERRKANHARIVEEEWERLGDQFSIHFQSCGKPLMRASAIAKRSQAAQESLEG